MLRVRGSNSTEEGGGGTGGQRGETCGICVLVCLGSKKTELMRRRGNVPAELPSLLEKTRRHSPPPGNWSPSRFHRKEEKMIRKLVEKVNKQQSAACPSACHAYGR